MIIRRNIVTVLKFVIFFAVMILGYLLWYHHYLVGKHHENFASSLGRLRPRDKFQQPKKGITETKIQEYLPGGAGKYDFEEENEDQGKQDMTRHTSQMITTKEYSNYKADIVTQQLQTDPLQEITHTTKPNIVLKTKSTTQLTSTTTQTMVCAKLTDQSSFHTGPMCLAEDNTRYFTTFRGEQCLNEGTARFNSGLTGRRCKCKTGWYGFSCSRPSSVQNSNYPIEYGVAIRKKPRRIIYGMPFLGEFDLLEARVNELGKLVDLYIFLESNYTARGKPKKRALLEKLNHGFLDGMHDRILYVSLDHFPPAARYNGWIIDALLRDHIGVHGLKDLVKNVRNDDIFLLTDADEIPNRESVLYLKVHTGYPEPFGFVYRHSVFGFFWQRKMSDLDLPGIYTGCSVGMLKHVFQYSAYQIRALPNSLHARPGEVDAYKKLNIVIRIHPWIFGTKDEPTGWHCSWCAKPDGILQKMVAAHVSDKPRWANYRKKRNLDYIKNLVKTGVFFDDKTKFVSAHRLQPGFAPKYLLKNFEKYKHILKNPYVPENKTLTGQGSSVLTRH